MRKSGGRNESGKITVRGRGGGHKRRHRFIDFKRNNYDKVGKIVRVEYDPNRSALIALVSYENDLLSYVLAPEGAQEGDSIVSSRAREIEVATGNAMPLRRIPVGQKVHNVELRPEEGGVLARSAGGFLRVLEKNSGPKGRFVTVELASKERRLLDERCLATIGRVGNVNHGAIILGKAGRNRNLGRRPKVRGVAMNPCDHPHGGGNGKGKGKHPVSKWGKLAKGGKTRKRHKSSDAFIIQRRPKNKNRYSSGARETLDNKWGDMEASENGEQ